MTTRIAVFDEIWFRSLRITLFLLLATLALNSSVNAGSDVLQSQAASIQLVLSDFYQSYITLLSENKSPSDEFLAKSVSIELIKKIRKQASSADGLDVDYFLDAQDYLDDWKANIAVTQITVVGNRARAVVSLGLAKPGKYQLSVNLMFIDREWKISQVRRRAALLRKSIFSRNSPDPRRTHATATVIGQPSCVKRFSSATRICNSTT